MFAGHLNGVPSIMSKFRENNCQFKFLVTSLQTKDRIISDLGIALFSNNSG